MKAIEPGQSWKTAALKFNFHVHFLYGDNMKKEFMDVAFEQAYIAFNNNEVPVGAVIVYNNQIIAKAYNLKESNKCSLSHAELIAISEASKKLNNWRLDDCDIYITLDPCPMCASAIKQSRIKNVYSALNGQNELNNYIVNKIFLNDDINPKVNFETNLAVDKSFELMSKFFENKRN